MLLALDGDGKQLGSERLVAGDRKAAEQLATTLIKSHLPPARDAKERLAEAREEAKRSGRKLWIVEGGPRCGPCFRLALDGRPARAVGKGLRHSQGDGRPRPALGGSDRAVNRPQSGIPWYAITEADGTILATCEGPNGNIGMPTAVEDLRHFRSMLEATAQRLTAKEIDALVRSVLLSQVSS